MPQSADLYPAMGNEVPLLSDTIVPGLSDARIPGQHPAANPLGDGCLRSYGIEDQLDLISILQPLRGVPAEADPWGSPDLENGGEWMYSVPRSCDHVEDVHDTPGSADNDVDDRQEPVQHTSVFMEDKGLTGPQDHIDALILPHPSKARVAKALAESLMPPHGAGNRERAQASLPSNPVDLVNALEKANRLRHKHRPQPDSIRTAAARQLPSDVSAGTPHQSRMARHEASAAGTESPEQSLRSHIESFEAGSRSECPLLEEDPAALQDPDVDRIQDFCWMSTEDLEESSVGHG